MAEATLNDVTNAIREDGGKDREQLKGDSIRQFLQLRSSNKLLTSLTQAQIDSNEQMKKQFEQEQEALRRANAKKTLGEPANDNDSRFKRMMTGLVDSYKGVQKLFNDIKKAMPNKATMFTLLFGGLAAAFAFFPKEVKEYLINPLIDVINVFRGKESTTGVGWVVEKLKNGLEWISENINPEAAWIVGILGVATALKGIGLPTFGLGSILGIIAKFAAAHPLITAAVAAITGLIALFDFFRRRTIKSETEKSKALLKEYEAAKDDEEKEKIARRAKAAQDRIRETAIGNVDSIQDPLKEIRRQQDNRLWLMAKNMMRSLYSTEQEAKKAKEEAEKAKKDAEDAKDANLPEAKHLGLVAKNKEKQADEAQKKTNNNRNDALLLYREQAENSISIAEDSDQLLAAYKESLKDTIAKFQVSGFEGDRLEEAIDAAVQDLNAAVKIRRRQADFKKIGGINSPSLELDRIKAAASNASSDGKLMAALEAGNKAGTFIGAPRTTNNNDNKKTVNNVYYNVFTDSNFNPAMGRYENGVVPTYM
jgi:hypothetical protein